MLTGTFSEEIEVNCTAAEAWKVHGTLQIYDILLQKLPDTLQKTEILQGEGGVGTVLKVTFSPGKPGPTYLIEKFTVVDDEKRLKIAEVTEGGQLAMGFTKFRLLFQVLEKDENNCINRVTVEYEIAEDASDKVPDASAKPFLAVLNAVADTLTNSKEA